MKTFVMFLIGTIASSVVYASGYDVCRSMSFESSRRECMDILRNGEIDEVITPVCLSMSFDNGKVSCVQAALNKRYAYEEADFCMRQSFDSRKVSCVQQYGRYGRPPGNGGGYNPPYPGPRPPEHNRPVMVRRYLRCDSLKYRTSTCAANLMQVDSAGLARQHSDVACIEGQSYSFNRDRVIVSAGCRATFEFVGLTRNPQNGDTIL